MLYKLVTTYITLTNILFKRVLALPRLCIGRTDIKPISERLFHLAYSLKKTAQQLALLISNKVKVCDIKQS